MATQVRVPGFTPSVNGLHFMNAFPHEAAIVVDLPPFGRIAIGDAANGLCGGMVFTVMDVAETPGMTPPPDLVPPDDGSPLFGYIVARLVDSFDLPNAGFMKYYDWMVTPDHDTGWPPFFVRRGVAWKTIVEEWPNSIKPELDAGRLCPLGLVTVASLDPTQLGQNHQVLAYGYDLDGSSLTLLIYDPNSAQASSDSVRVAFSLADPSNSTPISHNVNIGNPIRGLFRVPYRYNNPTGLQAPPPIALAPARRTARTAQPLDKRVLAARRLVVSVKPRRIRADARVSMVVQATDADTGKAVVGSVFIGGAVVASTGVPFAYTFFTPVAAPARVGRPRGAGPAKAGRRAAPVSRAAATASPPSGYVTAPGYLPAYLEFTLR